ncbi:hypothetical protein D3C81_1168430 [compost metagenome]
MQSPLRFAANGHAIRAGGQLKQGVHLQAFGAAQCVFQRHLTGVHISCPRNAGNRYRQLPLKLQSAQPGEKPQISATQIRPAIGGPALLAILTRPFIKPIRVDEIIRPNLTFFDQRSNRPQLKVIIKHRIHQFNSQLKLVRRQGRLDQPGHLSIPTKDGLLLLRPVRSG